MHDTNDTAVCLAFSLYVTSLAGAYEYFLTWSAGGMLPRR